MTDIISGERGNTAVYAVLASREAAGKPIRVGVVGAGATGRAIALQLGTPVPGMRLVAISNRTPAHAERAFREAGIQGVESGGAAPRRPKRVSRAASRCSRTIRRC